MEKHPLTGAAYLAFTGFLRKGGDVMTDYEILMVVLGVIGLLIAACTLLIALLSFLDKRNHSK